MFRNMVMNLFLTEREIVEGLDENAPKVKGRIITTITKAKEIRPLVEKCITIACKGLEAQQKAESLVTTAERGSDEWKKWRKTDEGRQWCDANAPAINARRRVMQLIRSDEAVDVLFSTIAPRFMERPGGYTRILRLAKPRLGDNGTRAILEFVGQNDRVSQKSAKPDFGSDEASDSSEEPTAETATADAGGDESSDS
jgi:large subunit ribosomal protein L17